MAGSSLKAALLVNFSIGVIKMVVGLATRSAAMFSEAIHSFADTFNQILLALGIRNSKKKPDLEHPFGYQKNQFFWSFVVAILIFGVSGILAFFEGYEKVLHPEEHHEGFIWNIVVLLGAMILEFYAFKTAYNEAKAYKNKMKTETIFDAFDEMQDPVLLSLIVEDTLALIGLTTALIGVSLSYFLHEPVIDGYTSMTIGIILMLGGLLLAKENKTYLIGKAVTHRTQELIRNTVLDFEHTKDILSMKTMMLGPKRMILALDVRFDATEDKIPDLIDELEQLLIKAVPYLKANKIFIEAQN